MGVASGVMGAAERMVQRASLSFWRLPFASVGLDAVLELPERLSVGDVVADEWGDISENS